MTRVFLALCAVFLMSGCIATISHYQLSQFNRGMSPQEITDTLKQAPLVRIPVNAGSRAFEFDRYLLNNGMGSDVYYLAYENQRLVFWGYVSEFRRHPDPVFGQAVDLAMQTPAPARAR